MARRPVRHLFHGVVAADRFDNFLLFALTLADFAYAVAVLLVGLRLGSFKVGAGSFVGVVMPFVPTYLIGTTRQVVMLRRGPVVVESLRFRLQGAWFRMRNRVFMRAAFCCRFGPAVTCGRIGMLGGLCIVLRPGGPGLVAVVRVGWSVRGFARLRFPGETAMSAITRRKTIEASVALDDSHRLRATLSWPHLIAIGVGAIVGTGIYTLTGVGAGLAGPAVIVSFLCAARSAPAPLSATRRWPR